MLPLLSITNSINFKKRNDLKLKLIEIFSEEQNKVFSKEELISKIYEIENINDRSERQQISYATSLRKLIQRTREILEENLAPSQRVDWFSYSRKDKGWKLYNFK